MKHFLEGSNPLRFYRPLLRREDLHFLVLFSFVLMYQFLQGKHEVEEPQNVSYKIKKKQKKTYAF